jgi:hypothetical protein
MTVDEIRVKYEEKVLKTSTPRWRSFDRILVGVLLDEIDRLTKLNESIRQQEKEGKE